MRRLLLPCAAGLALGCMGPNQLSGSVGSLFPLDVSRVDVLRNAEAMQISYYANRSANVDLVVQVTVELSDLTLAPGKHVALQGEYAPGHQRTTITHEAAGEPVRLLGTVHRGDLVLDSGGDPGTFTRGHFSVSFEPGDDYAASRGLEGTFDNTALDAGFGP